VTSAAAKTTGLDNCPLLARPDLSRTFLYFPSLSLLFFLTSFISRLAQNAAYLALGPCALTLNLNSLKIPHHIFLSLPAGKENDQ
jgi:hypothetical protein